MIVQDSSNDNYNLEKVVLYYTFIVLLKQLFIRKPALHEYCLAECNQLCICVTLA